MDDELVVVCDRLSTVLLLSRFAARLLDAHAPSPLGRLLHESGLFGDAAVRVGAALQRALGDGVAQRLEVEWATRARSRVLELRLRADAAGGRVLILGRDLTEQRKVERDLRMREYDFRTLAENSPDAIIRYGLDMRAVYCNREIEERVTVTAARVVGYTPAEAAPPGMVGVAEYERQLAHTLASGEGGEVKLQVPHPNGEVRVHSVVLAAEHDAHGRIVGAVAVGRDVTELVNVQRALALKEREFRSLAENAGDNIVRWAPDAHVLFTNPAMSRVFGHSAEQVLGRRPTQLTEGLDVDLQPMEDAVKRVAARGGEEMVELRFTAPDDGAQRVHQVRLVAERDDAGHVCSVLGVGRDITERVAQLELIESLLRTDPLTRLANRQALHERAPAMLAGAARESDSVAVLLLDLDQFKAINDSLGHSAGDRLLQQVAERLADCLRANDLLARLGGDEFVLVAPQASDASALQALSQRLHQALDAPVTIEHRVVRTTASVGVAVFPSDGQDLETLLSHADTAMYHAKRSGRARTEYYRRELGEAVRRRMAIEQALRGACEGQDLQLHFQPIVALDGVAQVRGYEALLRWKPPGLGLLGPDAFIGIAEETGMILPIGRWVLRTAALAAARWNEGRERALRVAVNVSTRQLVDDRMAQVVDEVLAQTGCRPDWLSIEITESALLHDSASVREALQALRARGIGIAIDDFGTGYSALNYLARFPIDVVKIDKCFVHGIGRSTRDDELVKAFVALAGALRLGVVAEGIETEAQATFLREIGCPLAQGWLFGRPSPEPVHGPG
ncbi:MAG: EAL domain-containing protein [Burkholderiales bacterium]|nr:EAL domain-containing protein [Burkholderiales bacterium]